MNKKGFTLVELLAVISILAIILLIGVPTISKVIKDNKEKAYDIQISSFLGSVKIWATDNVRNLPVSGSASEVTLAQLENQAYVAKDVKNPLTGSAFDTTMSFCVRNINGEYDYSVSDGTGCSATSTKTNDGCFAVSGNKITNYYDYVDNNSNNSVCPRDVVIPSSINGTSITEIGDSAFESKKITSVSIPDSVTMIDSEAFRSNNLITVIIPDSVTTLGSYSFYYNKLTSVTISKIFYTHDENDFFPEECYVTAYGELFEDCEGAYSTFGDAIKLWCEKTGVSQDGRSEQKMIDFINEYEYEAEDTNFCINPITFG